VKNEIIKVENNNLAQIIRVGLKNEYGVDVGIVTWTAHDTSYTWALYTDKKLSKALSQQVKAYSQGAVDCWRGQRQ